MLFINSNIYFSIQIRCGPQTKTGSIGSHRFKTQPSLYFLWREQECPNFPNYPSLSHTTQTKLPLRYPRVFLSSFFGLPVRRIRDMSRYFSIPGLSVKSLPSIPNPTVLNVPTCYRR